MSGEFQHINLDYLGQMTEGDRALERDMLLVLVKELQIEIPKLRALGAEGRWRELAEVSHRLKTSLAYAGNDALSRINAEIEAIASRGDGAGELPGLFGGLESAVPDVIGELQAAVGRLSADG
jgi:HPt (histidine-containing phosphotransfer) domain-containing protein